MGPTMHPRKNRLHGRARNYSGFYLSDRAVFAAAGSVLMGFAKHSILGSHLHFLTRVRCLAPGPHHAWLWHALGDRCQTRAVSGLLSSPQVTHGNNTAAMHPKLLSEGVHGHFGQCLTCTSCGEQGSSLGAVNQRDQKIPVSSGADTQRSRFHLDHRQPV